MTTRQNGAAASRKKRGAATADEDNEPKVVAFDDLEFTVPGTLPLSVSFDLAGIGGPFADIRFLGSVLGPEQTQILRTKLDADEISLDPDGTKILGDLIENIMEVYGFEVGESQASARS